MQNGHEDPPQVFHKPSPMYKPRYKRRWKKQHRWRYTPPTWSSPVNTKNCPSRLNWRSYQNTAQQYPRPIAGYIPRLLGHPHPIAEPQATEPFWQQYPWWTKLGNQLYFYPEFGGYFDHPLYTLRTMDDKPVVIGYGPKSRFARKPVREAWQPKPRGEMVDVYVSDLYVEAIGFKLLLRFSRAASNAFPRQQTKGADERSRGAIPERTAVGNTMSWADEVSEMNHDTQLRDKSRGTGSRTTSYPMTTTSGQWTPITVPSPVQAAKGVSRGLGGRCGKPPNKVLKLDLPVVDMPSVEATHVALKWMRDNANVPGDGKLLDYGSPDLHKISFEEAIDLYQAALALEMRPFPRRLKHHILDVITKSIPDMRMLITIARCLPAEDPVVTRLLNCIEDRIRQDAYSQVELEQFEHYIAEDGNELLQLRRRELLEARDEAAMHHQSIRANIQGSSWREHAGPPSDEPVSGKAETPTAAERETQAGTGKRRRNRRAQQQKGLNRNGNEVVGANY